MAKLKFNPANYQDLGAYALLKNIVENGHLVAEDPTPPAYKVYTALLTQNGGSVNSSINSGDLTIGVTYQLNPDGVGTANFINVGSPNNNAGTYFVATGTTPYWGSSGKLYYNTGAPVVTVLENTIGNIWLTYQVDGTYQIESNGLFTGTVPTVTNIFGVIESSTANYLTVDKISDSVLRLVSSDPGYAATNGLLNNTPIEIRVYN